MSAAFMHIGRIQECRNVTGNGEVFHSTHTIAKKEVTTTSLKITQIIVITVLLLP